MNMMCLGWKSVNTCGGARDSFGRNQQIVPPMGEGGGCTCPTWFYLGLAAIGIVAAMKH